MIHPTRQAIEDLGWRTELDWREYVVRNMFEELQGTPEEWTARAEREADGMVCTATCVASNPGWAWDGLLAKIRAARL